MFRALFLTPPFPLCVCVCTLGRGFFLRGSHSLEKRWASQSGTRRRCLPAAIQESAPAQAATKNTDPDPAAPHTSSPGLVFL